MDEVVEDLAVWLTAVWDEEERLAKATAKEEGADWGPGNRYNSDSVINAEGGYVATGPWEYMAWETRQHIAYHDPASVLARIAAVRKILELHGPKRNAFPEDRGICDTCPALCPCDTLLALASPYRGREGWREEWE